MFRLLPWWILGAPLVLALVDWMRTPKVRRRNDDEARPGGRPG